MKYTEAEIKAWFEEMKKNYKNCRMNENLKSVEQLMFDDNFWGYTTLKNFVEKNEKTS